MPGGVNLQQRHLIGKSLVRMAQELYLPAATWQIFSSASAHATSSSLYMKVGGADLHVQTIAASSTTCDMVFDAAFTAPLDSSTSGSVIPFVECLVSTNLATTGSGLGFQLNYNYINVAACSTTAGSVTGTVTNSSGSLGVGGRLSGSLSAMPSFAAGGQLVSLQMRGLTGACTAGANVDFAGLRLRYIADKTGASTTS